MYFTETFEHQTYESLDEQNICVSFAIDDFFTCQITLFEWGFILS